MATNGKKRAHNSLADMFGLEARLEQHNDRLKGWREEAKIIMGKRDEIIAKHREMLEKWPKGLHKRFPMPPLPKLPQRPLLKEV